MILERNSFRIPGKIIPLWHASGLTLKNQEITQQVETLTLSTIYVTNIYPPSIK